MEAKVAKTTDNRDGKKDKDVGSELVSASDVASMAGVSANTVHHWVARGLGFPKPIKHPSSGALYSRTAVVKWLKGTNRAGKKGD